MGGWVHELGWVWGLGQLGVTGLGVWEKVQGLGGVTGLGVWTKGWFGCMDKGLGIWGRCMDRASWAYMGASWIGVGIVLGA